MKPQKRHARQGGESENGETGTTGHNGGVRPCTTLSASAEAEDPALSLDSTHSDASLRVIVGAPQPRPTRLAPSQSASLSWHAFRAL